ncbi:diaminopimelate epimerase [Planomicrobium sp. YIM 101495]|uniref:diaminopimelate epimerase n=1 Tax=Planomicrobium sp. YIM 101495 TaxID=2665160 RepID=UPI0013FC5E7A|nr:diaminopimelate epimerase [Planomicrobium sp. YIM 101495]
MEYSLLKVHGSKNTFYLLEAEDRDWSALAMQVCALDADADGLLVVSPSKDHDAKMRVFNRDGSEASMCGNGLRCVARYVCERDEVNSAVIETMKAALHVRKEQELGEGIPTYAVEISPVLFNLSALPMRFDDKEELQGERLPFMEDDIAFTAVAVPNPHLIGIVSPEYQSSSAHQEEWASYFNGDNPYFLDGVNVSYVTPVEDGIFVRTFERGVGFTNACGTAMTASALVSVLTGHADFGEVTVYNPGGMVKCTVREEGDSFALELKGNATFLSAHVFEWSEENGSGKFLREEMRGEQEKYDHFSEEVIKRSRELFVK